MKMKKALVALVCAIALVTATFLGTMAYFTSQDTVTNTFTVGKVKIDLDEKNFDGKDKEGKDNSSVERDDYNTYHLIPGVPVEKDPRVTVEANSEDAYVRMLVNVKNMDHLKKAFEKKEAAEGATLTEAEQAFNAKYWAEDLFLIQSVVEGWDKDTWKYVGYTSKDVIEKDKDNNDVTVNYGTYEFRYHNKTTPVDYVVKSEQATVLDELFEKVLIDGPDVNNDEIALLADVVIEVEAHAIQKAGFDNADQAWAAFTK